MEGRAEDHHVSSTAEAIAEGQACCILLEAQEKVANGAHSAQVNSECGTGACLVEELVQHEGDDDVRLHGQVLAAIQLREYLCASGGLDGG